VFEERKLPTPEEAKHRWTERHVAELKEAMSASIFEAFIPLAQQLKARPDGEYLTAFALKYFFQHHRIEKMTDVQKAELKTWLTKVVRQSYRRNITKTLDYDVSYKGSKEAGGDTRVLTEAKSKSNPRDTPVRVDYVVKQTPKGLLVVDIVTEGSSFSKNLYVQFRKYMQDADGYDHIVTKLREKAAKKD